MASNAEFLELGMRYRRMDINCKQIFVIEEVFLASFTTFYLSCGVGTT
jgi:hypothetical protein